MPSPSPRSSTPSTMEVSRRWLLTAPLFASAYGVVSGACAHYPGLGWRECVALVTQTEVVEIHMTQIPLKGRRHRTKSRGAKQDNADLEGISVGLQASSENLNASVRPYRAAPAAYGLPTSCSYRPSRGRVLTFSKSCS